jgi:GTP-binding protein HflX
LEEQSKVVEQTLADLGCGEKPTLIVFNKIDAYTWDKKDADDLTPVKKNEVPLEDLKRTWMAKMGGKELSCIFISAREKENIEELRDTLYKRVRELHVQKYPYNDFLYQTPS